MSFVAAHEVGHSIKMAHTSTLGSVMRVSNIVPVIPGGSGNITISSTDLNNVNTKWK